MPQANFLHKNTDLPDRDPVYRPSNIPRYILRVTA